MSSMVLLICRLNVIFCMVSCKECTSLSLVWGSLICSKRVYCVSMVVYVIFYCLDVVVCCSNCDVV